MLRKFISESKEKTMTLKLEKNPKFKKRVEYTSEEKRKSFEEFYQLANKYYHLKQLGRKKSERVDIHWKDELLAIINPKDFDRYADAVAFVCGSPLEVEQNFTRTKQFVRASGYWNCIGM
tara:strand:+ start:576 stop:935 length:360 start_codon:yes stop_codon:yes gene_type:complete